MKDIMRVTGKLSGHIVAQPSKSAAHRSILSASLAEGESRIGPVQLSEDIEATLSCASSLGLMTWKQEGTSIIIQGLPKEKRVWAHLDCGESGSTLRFFLPLAPIFAEGTEFIGRGRLMERPVEPFKSLLIKKGVTWGGMTLAGRYQGGEFALPGNVSSQFVSGLLFALPLLEEPSRICLTTPLESAGYVALTQGIQAAFGVSSNWESERVLHVPGGQRYLPRHMRVEGDFSHAAFFAVAGALGGGVEIVGLPGDSCQGDKAIFPLLEEMGAQVSFENGAYQVAPGPLRGIEVDARQIPDLVPILAVAGAYAEGKTHIRNAGRLRIKESDRLSAMAEELTRLGAKVEEQPDGLVIWGGNPLKGGRVNSHNDHRIAMSLAIAAGFSKEPVEIEGWECVKKSAPHFWSEFGSLGGEAYELGK